MKPHLLHIFGNRVFTFPLAQGILYLGIFFVCSPAAVADASDNFAANPGFEEWPQRPEEGVAAWGATGYMVGVEGREGTLEGEAYRTGEGESDTERHSGRYAQYIKTYTYGRGAISQGVKVIPGYRYRVSVWAKTLEGKFQLGVCFSHAPWTYLGDWVDGEPDGEWIQYSKEVVIPEDCQAISAVMFFQHGSGYLDDFELLELGPAESTE